MSSSTTCTSCSSPRTRATRRVLKQRWATLAARGRAASADAVAREFGLQRGALNLVNWVSDQYSQYGTKVVSVAEREAIHTLEAILHA
jgi:TnpA family transposase